MKKILILFFLIGCMFSLKAQDPCLVQAQYTPSNCLNVTPRNIIIRVYDATGTTLLDDLIIDYPGAVVSNPSNGMIVFDGVIPTGGGYTDFYINAPAGSYTVTSQISDYCNGIPTGIGIESVTGVNVKDSFTWSWSCDSVTNCLQPIEFAADTILIGGKEFVQKCWTGNLGNEVCDTVPVCGTYEIVLPQIFGDYLEEVGNDSTKCRMITSLFRDGCGNEFTTVDTDCIPIGQVIEHNLDTLHSTPIYITNFDGDTVGVTVTQTNVDGTTSNVTIDFPTSSSEDWVCQNRWEYRTLDSLERCEIEYCYDRLDSISTVTIDTISCVEICCKGYTFHQYSQSDTIFNVQTNGQGDTILVNYQYNVSDTIQGYITTSLIQCDIHNHCDTIFQTCKDLCDLARMGEIDICGADSTLMYYLDCDYGGTANGFECMEDGNPFLSIDDTLVTTCLDVSPQSGWEIQANFHQGLFRLPNGTYYFWGESVSATGGNLISPTEVSPANGFTTNGSDILICHMSYQGVCLTADGTFWASGPSIIPLFEAFPSGTYGANDSWAAVTVGLPSGVAASDVDDMQNNVDVVSILANGTVYILGDDAVNYYGQSSNLTWYPIQLPTGVTVVDYDMGDDGYMIQGSDGNVYTGGHGIYDGSSSQVDNNTIVATQMTLPAGACAIQDIGMNDRDQSIATLDQTNYYILDVCGNVWALGDNAYGQLGIGTSQVSLVWVQSGTGTCGTTFTTATQLTVAQTGLPYVGIIDANDEVWGWGVDSADGLGAGGTAGNEPVFCPLQPCTGGSAPSPLTAQQMSYGGHISPSLYADQNTGQIFMCNSGHNASGAYGDGTLGTNTCFECTDISSFFNCDQ